MAKTPRLDVRVENHGNIIQFFVLTPKARKWVDTNVQLEGWQWLGGISFAVDHHYADNLIQGMECDGDLVVS